MRHDTGHQSAPGDDGVRSPIYTYDTLDEAIREALQPNTGETRLTFDQAELFYRRYLTRSRHDHDVDVELMCSIDECGDEDHEHDGEGNTCMTSVEPGDPQEFAEEVVDTVDESITEFFQNHWRDEFRVWPKTGMAFGCEVVQDGQTCITRFASAKCDPCIAHLEEVSQEAEG